MIERKTTDGIVTEGGTPHWWTGRDFSTDPNAGIRFARAIDAQHIIETHGLMHATATDHEWVGR